jgi:hypothetical protein
MDASLVITSLVSDACDEISGVDILGTVLGIAIVSIQTPGMGKDAAFLAAMKVRLV